MTDWIDEALTSGLLAPSVEFTQRVMAEVCSRPLPVRATRPSRARAALEWLALAGAVLAGLAQLLPFLFGLWIFGNAV